VPTTRASFFHLAFDVNSQISRKKISGKRQTNNFRSVATFSVEILGLWAASRATTSINLSRQRLSKKGPGDIFRFKQQTKCSGCKMSVLCFFDAVPFLMESKDDDIVGRGLVPYNVILPL